MIKQIQKLDKESQGIITFEDLRNIMQVLNIQLKENYIEYMIYKMKLGIEESRVMKIEYLAYGPILELFSNPTDIYSDHGKDESSLDEEDLKEGVDQINFIKQALTKPENERKEVSSSNLGILSEINTLTPENVINSDEYIESAHTNKFMKTKSKEYENEQLSRPDNQIKSDVNHMQVEAHEPEEDIEISIGEFNNRNEKILYKIAEYLLIHKTYVSALLPQAKDQRYISSNQFFEILAHLNLKLDTLDQYCILMKLGDDDHDNIDVEKLKEEMTNYGVIEGTPESVRNNENKKFTNKYYNYDQSIGNPAVSASKQELPRPVDIKEELISSSYTPIEITLKEHCASTGQSLKKFLNEIENHFYSQLINGEEVAVVDLEILAAYLHSKKIIDAPKFNSNQISHLLKSGKVSITELYLRFNEPSKENTMDFDNILGKTDDALNQSKALDEDNELNKNVDFPSINKGESNYSLDLKNIEDNEEFDENKIFDD